MIDTSNLQKNIYQILKTHNDGLSEYKLIQELKKTNQLSNLEEEPSLTLFRHHFIVMHCLYHLHDQLWEKGKLSLSISPLKIKLTELSEYPSASISVEGNANLREYYLDWSNLESTDKSDVDGLLNQFWQDYAQYIRQDEAWEILSVPVGSAKNVIAKRYRELAAIHHPDKGGDQEMFIKIRAAYEALK